MKKRVRTEHFQKINTPEIGAYLHLHVIVTNSYLQNVISNHVHAITKAINILYFTLHAA